MNRPLILFASMLVAGCVAGASAPARFYALSPIEAEAAPPSATPLTLGVGPIDIPVALDRPEIITRTGAHQVDMAAFDRWAGSLRDQTSRILAENLSILLGTNRVALFPLQISTPVDYQVAVEVLDFRAVPGDSATLIATWTVTRGQERKALILRKSTYRVPLSDKEPAAVVAALSQALAALSRDIADGIRKPD